MNITLSYVGYLNMPDIKNGSSVSIEEGATLAELLTRCGILQAHQRHIQLFVNEEKQKAGYVLQEGDAVNLVIQIGGG